MSVNPQAFRRLMREIKQLQTEPPEGIRIQTDEENILDVTGIIQGPDGTPYKGGYFKLKFQFSETFPSSPPKCWFMTKIFHPNVSKSGEICVNTLKKDWKPEYGIAHILVTVKCLLIYPNPESALDESAGKLLLEKYEDYCKHARLMTSVHATPKIRPSEFDVPSVIPDAKPSPKPSTSASSSTPVVPATATLPVPSTSTRQTTPSPSPATLSAPPPRVNAAVNSPLGSLNSDSPMVTTTSMKPVSKGSHPPTSLHVEPLQPSSNGHGGPSHVHHNSSNAENVPDLKVPITGGKGELKRANVGGAPGGAEKRKKGLKRL